MFKYIRRYPFSLLIILVIIYLSFYKPSERNMINISNIDKLAHFCMYAGFCSVVWIEYFLSHKILSGKHMVIGAIVAPIIFSGLVEVMQGCLTTYRGMDWYDLLFNTIGVVFAAFFAKYFIRPKVNEYKTKKNSNN